VGDVAGTATDTGTATDFDIAERQLRDVLVHDSFWPSYPLWSALFEAELGGTGGTGSDVAAWQQAMDLIRLTSSPAQLLPYAGLRLGLAQIEAGDRAAALESLQAASVRAAELGAGLVTDEVAQVAARAGLVLDGGAVLHRRTGDSAELTARERQVLELIGEGLSNRQIGERLFISAKTASVHVSAILRKLGASSRTEAVFLARSLAEPVSP
jgi:DNA-binding CsgD family transcriptional regulator